MDPVVISDSDFHKLVSKRAQSLLGLADFVARCDQTQKVLVRPLLGDLHSQAMQIEELLDAYDARNNCRWCSFRSVVAATKLFSDACYELLHIKHALPAYRLLAIDEGDFGLATNHILEYTGQVVRASAENMLVLADYLALPTLKLQNTEIYNEHLLPGRLVRNCKTKRVDAVSEMVTSLATNFLNLAAESQEIRDVAKIKSGDYPDHLRRVVREENLRSHELRFHNLQSQYDTYVAGTQAEKDDPDLLVLRGHISVVFHLFKTATMFAHYHERHGSKKACVLAAIQKPLFDVDELLTMLMSFCTSYINQFIVGAERLCRNMLQTYSTVGKVEVPIPQYRGFHVRPSTLVSKLVLHYGCSVTMKLGDESYDAQMSLELFRANEKINAEKRRWLANEIVRLKLISGTASDSFEQVVRKVVLALAASGKLIMYEQPLQFPEESAAKEGNILDRVISEVNRFLAVGKIDIESSVRVVFIGDLRVLEDIRLLAEVGYGEDKFGNNIPLPRQLQYLRR